MSASSAIDSSSQFLGLSVGVIGHVDSGKTSLVRALSSVVSTAGLDKSPAARERGITLDLGFSAIIAPIPKHSLSTEDDGSDTISYSHIQITLVDCPGHASLMRTVLCGSCIIEAAVLVVDAVRGEQAQTRESLVVAEVAAGVRSLVVVINKMDLVPEPERATRLMELKRHFEEMLASTRFIGAPIVTASAEGTLTSVGELRTHLLDIAMRKSQIQTLSEECTNDEPFCLAVDHCFQVKGQGTVFTGTVLSGSLSVGSSVELPSLGEVRRVRGMQMFRRPARKCSRGDRVGVCVSNIDSSLVERGLLCSPPASLTLAASMLCLMRRLPRRLFPHTVKCNSKIHISIGPTIVLATCIFFGKEEIAEDRAFGRNPLNFRPLEGFLQQDELLGYDNDGEDDTVVRLEDCPEQWALLHFPHPVLLPGGVPVIGGRLDADVSRGDDKCRVAMWGKAVKSMTSDDVRGVRLYRWKIREGVVVSVGETRGGLCYEAEAGDLFCRGGPSALVGKRVRTESGYVGVLTSALGVGGRFKVRFEQGAAELWTGQRLSMRYKKFAGGEDDSVVQGDERDEPVILGIGPMPDISIDGTTNAVVGKKSKKKEQQKKCMEDGGGIANCGGKNVRRGVVESLKGELIDGRPSVVIVCGMFSPEEAVGSFVGRLCSGVDGEKGAVLGPFAKMGKAKVEFPTGYRSGVGSVVEMVEGDG